MDKDVLYDQAIDIILEYDKASVSLLQRKLKIGYVRAGFLMKQLEGNGVVGPFNTFKPREILIKR